MTSVAAFAVLVAFTGCSRSTDMFDQGAIDERDRQEQERIDEQRETIVNQNYAAAFERAFGKVGANVDWGFGRQPSRALTRGKNDYPSKGTLTAEGITFPDDCNPSNFIKEEDIPSTATRLPDEDGEQGGRGPYYIDTDTKKVDAWASGCVIYVKGDVDLTNKTFSLNIDSKIYLTEKSHLKLGSYAADGLNVSFYIAKDAILEVPGHLKIQSYPIYNHGTLNVGSLELCSTKENTSGMLYNVGKLIAKGDVKSDNNKSYIVNDGEIKAGSVHVEGQAAFQNNAEWEVADTTVINCRNGGWVNNGHWKTKYYAYTAGSNNVINNCYLWVTEDFEMNIGSTDGAFRIDTGGGVLTKNFYGGRDSSTGAISGPFKIVMGQKAVFKVENIAQLESGRGAVGEGDTYDFGIFGPPSGEYAVFQAKTIVREASIANTWGAVTYGGNLYVSAESHFAQGDDGSLNVLHPYIITQGDFTLKNIYAAGDANFSSGKPNITIPKTECSPGFQGGDPLYRVIAEDLSAEQDGDFDFNDVVFDVVKAESGKTTLKLICAGGVLPLRVMGQEVHALFGDTTPELEKHPMYNTGAGPDKDPVIFEVEGTYTTPAEIKDITIEVYKNDQWMELTATTGKAACKILVDDTFKIAGERENIADENENFYKYVQGTWSEDGFWWKSNQ